MPQVVVAGVINWWAVAYYAVVIAYSVHETNRQKRRARQLARDAYNESLQDRLNMVSSADGARSRLYGETRNVDGVVFKAAHGAHSEFYTLVVALAGHECESIEKVYFNDQELELESDGAGGWWVMTAPFLRNAVVSASEAMTTVGTTASIALAHTPISGSVYCVQVFGVGIDETSVDYPPTSIVGNVVTVTGVDPAHTTIQCNYSYVNDIPKARIWKYLGTDSQDIGSDLLASRFPALINTGSNDDRFAGMCCLVVELQYDQDAFPTGVPNVTALVRGAKCYDPRTGLTAWTQNPAIIARDWSLYAHGGGCSSSELDEGAFLAAANACDVSTDFDTVDGIEIRPLYQCDIVCKLDVPPDQGWLNEIVESMAGKWGWAGGALTLVAGVYRAPVTTITEDWVSDVEDIAIVKDAPLSEVVNVYRPSIANADAPVSVDGYNTTAAYSMSAMPEIRSPAFIAVDGLELPIEVTLGGVAHNVHAQHICGVMMRDARYAMTLRLPCKMHAWTLELFDVVYVTLPIFGLDAQEFEVIGWEFDVEKGIMLTLKRIDASIFDPDAGLELPDASLNTSMVLPWVVEDITGLAVDDAPEDGTQQSRALVTWDAVVGDGVRQSGKVEIQYTQAGIPAPSGDWSSWIEQGGATSAVVTGLRDGFHYLFKARAVNSLGVRGAWSLPVIHITSVPLIGTPNLGPNAATEVIQGALDSTVYVGAYGATMPGQMIVTPDYDGQMTVVIYGQLSASNGTGSAAIARGRLNLSVNAVAVAGGVFRRQVVAGEVWEELISNTHTMNVTAGVAYTIGFDYSDHVSATQTSNLTNISTRAELIYR